MTAVVAQDLAQIPMSPYLAASLERAAEYANAQAHREVTLEHVLLALAEDPEATVILRSSDIDVARLQTDVSNFLGNITERQDPGDPRPVSTSLDLQRILEAAAEAAKQGQRREINGAILLAAIVGDGTSTAAHILRAQGLTFEATISALRNAVRQQTPAAGTAPPPPPDALQNVQGGDPASTEDVLASARARVNKSLDPNQVATPAAPEPQWESASTPAAEPQSPTVSEALADQPVPSPAPPPAPPQPRQAGSGTEAPGNPHWAPPQPDEKAERSPQKRLQRVPPPLPLDAGLRPPRSEMPPRAAPQPESGAAPQIHTGGSAGAAGQPPLAKSRRGADGAPGQRASHVPPWVGDAGATRGQPNAAGVRPRSTQIKVETGQLVENIPRKMKAGISELVEVRIARANVKALAQGLQGGGAAYQHETMITKAMSVKLRAPDGGFWVEAASPETQWIDNVLGVMTDDFASWRWTVTPKSSGRKKLQLVVSARTVGSDGLAAETALPDQLYNVRVSVNYAKTSKRAAGWLAAAIFGGVLARFGEGAFDMAKLVVSKITGV